MCPSIFNRFPVIQAVKSKGRHFSTFFAHCPWVRPWDYRGKCYMDRKRIQCLSNASQHVPISLQPLLRYSDISVASDWFLTDFVSEWAFFYHILLSPGYAPGTIAVNVTRLERGFNACKTPRCIYPSIFNRFWDIASYWSKIATFYTQPLFSGPAGVPSEFREDLDTHKTRMNGLSCGEESMIICSAVLIQ